MRIVRCLPIALVMAGCAFSGPGVDGPDAEEEPIDIPPAAQPVPRHCGTDEPGLVLCVDFEDASLAQFAIDGSTYGNDATATNVTSIPRIQDESAAELAKMSSLRVSESDMLDVPKFTIEMWIRPTTEPGDKQVAGLFDNPGQYSMLFENKRRVRCGITGDNDANSEGGVPMNVWSHVACRYDGNEMRIYINGQLSECARFDAQVESGGLPGSAIGSRLIPMLAPLTPVHYDRFLGGVDNVRIFDRPLLDDQICTAAGQASGTCHNECPVRDYDDDRSGPGGGGPGD